MSHVSKVAVSALVVAGEGTVAGSVCGVSPPLGHISPPLQCPGTPTKCFALGLHSLDTRHRQTLHSPDTASRSQATHYHRIPDGAWLVVEMAGAGLLLPLCSLLLMAVVSADPEPGLCTIDKEADCAG